MIPFFVIRFLPSMAPLAAFSLPEPDWMHTPRFLFRWQIMSQLKRHGVIVEDMGGDVLCAKISAKKGTLYMEPACRTIISSGAHKRERN